MKLYRGQYLIGIYGPEKYGETLLALCSNIREFAELMKIKYDNAVQILHYLFTKQTSFIRFQGMLCSVEFILDKTDEEEVL